MPTVCRSPLRLISSAIAVFLIAGAGLFGSEALTAAAPGDSPASKTATLISPALIFSSPSPYLEIGQAVTGLPSATPLPASPSPALSAIPLPSPTPLPASPSPTPSPTPLPSFSETPPPPRTPAPTNKTAGPVLYNFSIPALGVDGSIRNLSQCGETIPNAGIWYWGDGCAGENNRVLLAHAYSAFAPIYHGYHSGALRVGLAASYVDASGTSHAYFIAQIWRQPVAQAFSGWAFVAEQSPVITLITCDDPDSSYRIIVRLIPTGTSNPNPTLPPSAAPTATVGPTIEPTTAPTAFVVPTPAPIITPTSIPTPEPAPSPMPTASSIPTPTIIPSSDPTPTS